MSYNNRVSRMSKRIFRESKRKPQLLLPTKPRRTKRKPMPKLVRMTRRIGSKSAASGRFLGSRRNEGCSVALVVVERTGSRVDRVSSSLELSAVGTGGAAKLPRSRKDRRQTSKQIVEIPARVCQAMFALGHTQRTKVIRKLLDGPATYQALKRLTKLEPGPLYHHVNQLRLAGLILPRQRDLYELTRAGRNIMLGMLVLAPLTHDSRRRPTA